MAVDWSLEFQLIVCGGESPQGQVTCMVISVIIRPKSYAQYSTQIGDIFWVLQLLVVPTFIFQQIFPSSLPSPSFGVK